MSFNDGGEVDEAEKSLFLAIVLTLASSGKVHYGGKDTHKVYGNGAWAILTAPYDDFSDDEKQIFGKLKNIH